MKEIKTKEFRDIPKGKDRGSPLSDQLKKEMHHVAVSQMQTGEEQDNASDYASDKTIKTADRVVSEAAHGVSVAAEAGKHLFVEHLRKEPHTSSSVETPIPDESPLWDMPPAAEPYTPPAEPAHHTAASPQSAYEPAKEFIQDVIYHQEPVYTQPAITPAADFKGRASSIQVDNAAPLKTSGTISPNTPQTAMEAGKSYAQQSAIQKNVPQITPIQGGDIKHRESAVQIHTPTFRSQEASITPNPEFVAKLEAKRELIEQEITASMQHTVIPAGQSPPTKSAPTEPRMFNASKDRIPVNTEHQIHAVEAGRAFAQESAVGQIADSKAASSPTSVTAPKSKDAKEPTLKLRLEEESNKPQIKVKGYEAPKKAAVPQEQELKAAAKQFAKESEIKGQTVNRLTVEPLPVPQNGIVPTEALSEQKSGIKKLFPQKASAKGKIVPEKKPQAKAFSKAGKNLKLSERDVKTADHILSAPSAATRMRQAFIGSVEKAKQAEQVKKAAEAVAAFAKKAAERSARAAKAIAQATQELISALAAGGGTLLIIVVILVVMGFAGMMFASDDDDIEIIPVSDEVKAYEPIIQKYAKQYGIGEYILLIEAVMMQESGGRTTDPMQCSECNFNTRYPHAPGSITDPEYSIEVGIQNLADCLEIAGCESPIDMDHIKLALQGYNYGQGYITWALNKYGEYSKANAIEFSIKTAEQVGWNSYGDKDYVPHVLRYYPLGQIFYDPDTSTLIVEVAASQIGNVGGEPYWRWYGFTDHVEWCACFVSWCADQCGYLDTAIPKYAGCVIGANWFKGRSQWADRSITPEPGMIIFFDWGGDGIPDHTGIVEKCENGYVYTIEGNSSDSCRRRQYTIGSSSIFGYGMPNY